MVKTTRADDLSAVNVTAPPAAVSSNGLRKAQLAMLDTIPAALRNERRWVNARIEMRGAKAAKVPYCPHDPTRKADTTDPGTWSDYGTARRLVEHGDFPALGFVLGDGFVGVDLDACRDPETGVVEPWAQSIISDLDSYTEVSLSETGVHIICRGALPPGGRRKGQVEMYEDARYFVMTGGGADKPIEDRTAELAAVHASVFGVSESALETPDAERTCDISDEDLLNGIRASKQGVKFEQLWSGDIAAYPSRSEADQALCTILAFWTHGDAPRIDRLFRSSGLHREKWERADYRQQTLACALRSTTERYQPGTGPADAECAADAEPASQRGGKSAKSHASKLVRLVTDRPGVELFHADDLPYVTVAGKTLAVRGSHFRDWLSREYFQLTNRVPSASALADAVATLAGGALHQGPERDVFTRVAAVNKVVYVDLGGNAGVVEVTDAGWRVVSHCDVRFLRRPGFLPLPLPVHSEVPLDVLFKKFLNVHDERDVRLMIAWTLGALRGRKPYPILNVNGEQGSAKSSACRFLRRLIDPNSADTRLPPRDARDLMIAAHNSFVIAYENLTRIDDWLSNGLCCLSTGAGSATRALCTDTDEIRINVARPILLNGINDVIRRADLLDRTMAVTLDPIPDENRKTEAEVDAAFLQAQPAILGGLLDAVACALKNEPTTRPTHLPRMADFAITVTAAEPALGWKPGSFLKSYAGTRRVSMEGLLDGDALAAAIQRMPLPWSGTAGTLHRLLTNNVPHTDLDQFPKGARRTANKLRELAPGLRQVGIDVTFQKGHDRTISVRRSAVQVVDDDE
jgi:hypothetical protein